jgi:hypothetical protein
MIYVIDHVIISIAHIIIILIEDYFYREFYSH